MFWTLYTGRLDCIVTVTLLQSAFTRVQVLDPKLNTKSSCWIGIKFSGKMHWNKQNIRVNFRCKRPNTKKVIVFYATTNCTLLHRIMCCSLGAVKLFGAKLNYRRAVLPALRFSREFGLVVCVFAFFLKTYGLLVFGVLLIEICLFFGLVFCRFLFWDCFLFKFCGTFAVSIYCLWHIGRVFVKICSFWACIFEFASLLFCLIFLLIFRFVEFSCQRTLGMLFG